MEIEKKIAIKIELSIEEIHKVKHYDQITVASQTHQTYREGYFYILHTYYTTSILPREYSLCTL